MRCIAIGFLTGNSHKSQYRRPAIMLTALLSFSVRTAQAQPTTKTPRIGFQVDASISVVANRIEAFRQSLRDLGYIEGKNIIIEWRSAEGKPERRSEIAAELVNLKPDVIVSAGPTATRALREATSTIPIVMAQDTDPVGSGFVASLARPGGNITGLSALAPEMSGKQLELLKQIVPKLSRVAIVGNSSNPGDAETLRETVLVGGSYEIYLRYLDVQDVKNIDFVIQSAAKGRADALMSSAIRYSTCSDVRSSNSRLNIACRRPTPDRNTWKPAVS